MTDSSVLVYGKLVRVLSGTTVCLTVLALGVLAWLRFAPVSTADGWQYSEVLDGLDRVVALARMPDGSILSTLSAKQRSGMPGAGRLLKLDIATGRHVVLADGLYKPAGLLPWEGDVVLTQEFSDQPVLLWRDGLLRPLLMLNKPESIAATAQGRWLMIEDTVGGRLVEIDPEDGYSQKTLVGGFVNGEGLCVGRDQRIFVVDRKNPNLLEYADGELKPVPAKLNGAGFLRCTADGIWITEDVTNNGRLWFYDYGSFHLIASHLHSPQSVLEDGADAVLVAEQGRSRLLRFSRD